ncbi:PREDICTED: uncharacterized protein LOC108510091 isoform X38 [Lepidothrix coronata]|uniref:Uncharacterized protein LOC108510091 isoform X38 n=1 Tax=Lepidothrix coronata TaxID=321398 RepID=A0A6J0JAV1_9PASS|nr:PREDICTED: uncharacterized protein LOC108510091 isoform X38 [Lepidothrix coronata]
MFGMSWEEKMDPGASLDPWLQGCKHWEEGHSHLPGCLGWDGKGPLGAGTFPPSRIFGMGWEGATGSRDIPNSWMFGMGWDGKEPLEAETFPPSWMFGMGWDGKEPLGSGKFPPSQIFGMSWEGKRDPGASLDPGSGGVNPGIRDIPTFPDIWDELGREEGSWSIPGSWLQGCKHWEEGHSQFLDVWDGMGRGHWKPEHSQFLDIWDGMGRSHWKPEHSHLPGRVIPNHNLEYSPSWIQRDEESPGSHSRVIPSLGSDTTPPGNVHYPGKSCSGSVVPAFPEPGSGSRPSWNVDFPPIFGNFFPPGLLFPLKIMD